MRVGSCDPSLLAGDTECHQLYKPPGYTTGGLLLIVCQVNLSGGEGSVVVITVGSSPFLGSNPGRVSTPISTFRVLCRS